MAKPNQTTPLERLSAFRLALCPTTKTILTLRVHGMVLFWIAFVLTRPLGATAGDFLSKPHDDGGLEWGTAWTSATLLGVLIVLIAYQTMHIRRHPLEPVPAPVHRRTGEPQKPNGELVSQPA